MLRAAGGGATPRLLGGSAVAANLTGTVNETALATVTVPAGAMGTNGGLHIYTTWSVTSSANNKQLRIRLGGLAGTQYLSATFTTIASFADMRRIRNRNSASSQIGSVSIGSVSFASSAAALPTSAVDTSVAVDLSITGQLALGTETITLESYEIWLVP